MLQLTELNTHLTKPSPGYFYVPELDVFAHDMYAPLVKEIQDELVRPEFKRFRHGRCGTNNRGCSGPLCRKARRDWRLANAITKAQIQGRKFTPRESAEKELTDWLFAGFEEHVAKTWVDRKTRNQLEKELREVSELVVIDPTWEIDPSQLLVPEFI